MMMMVLSDRCLLYVTRFFTLSQGSIVSQMTSRSTEMAVVREKKAPENDRKKASSRLQAEQLRFQLLLTIQLTRSAVDFISVVII